MKKFLNPLWLAPVLGFLISLSMFLFDNNYKVNDIPSILLVYGLYFLPILLLNIWNYNIVNPNKGNSYNILMTIVVFILSSILSLIAGKSSDGGFGFFIIIFFYIIVSLILISANILAYVSISNKSIEENHQSNNHLDKVNSKPFFAWYNTPLLFIILIIAIKFSLNLLREFSILSLIPDILPLLPYILILQVNNNFFNAKSLYRIIMTVLLIVNTGVYLYITMSELLRKDIMRYILYFPLMRVISLIILIVIGRIDKKNQNKLISQT